MCGVGGCYFFRVLVVFGFEELWVFWGFIFGCVKGCCFFGLSVDSMEDEECEGNLDVG